MPELPEVETVVNDLNRAPDLLGARFVDAWTDTAKIIRLRPADKRDFGGQVKKPRSFAEFKKEIVGKKIQKIWRRAKNIIFDLSENCSLLIHQKMTGHLLYGKWHRTNNKWHKTNGQWQPVSNSALREKVNDYIHLIFFLDNGKMLALSDLRKFAKTELWQTQDLKNSKEFRVLGPEPLEKDFTFEKFKIILENKKSKIKQVLMDQNIIAGIGNIYSDEILWEAKVHPLKNVSELNGVELGKIYEAVKKVLKKAIKLRGTSISDFRDIKGKPGFYAKERKVYQREGEKCSRCSVAIKRIKIGGRSSHFCPSCQQL